MAPTWLIHALEPVKSLQRQANCKGIIPLPPALLAVLLQKNETLLQFFKKKHLAPPKHSGILSARLNSQTL